MQTQEVSSFVWYELHTPDAAGAGAFYSHVFGWTLEDVSALGRPYLTLKAGAEPVGGILPKASVAFEKDDTYPRWMGYVQVDDADTFLHRVTRAGGEVRRAIEEISGLGRFAVVADPMGALFVIFQPFSLEASFQPHESREHGFEWAELICKNRPEQFQFYSSACGWKESVTQKSDPTANRRTFMTNGATTESLSESSTTNQASEWVFHVKVNDISGAIRRTTDAGGLVIEGPIQVVNGRLLARCIDPQGVLFGMVATA